MAGGPSQAAVAQLQVPREKPPAPTQFCTKLKWSGQQGMWLEEGHSRHPPLRVPGRLARDAGAQCQGRDTTEPQPDQRGPGHGQEQGIREPEVLPPPGLQSHSHTAVDAELRAQVL